MIKCLDDPVIDFATDGWRVIRFVETFCRNVSGPEAGKVIQLRTWQKELILELYRLDENGRRIYRRGLWGLARKNGKTMIGACLALYHLLADNEIGAEVYSVAGDRDQARICFRYGNEDGSSRARISSRLHHPRRTGDHLTPC